MLDITFVQETIAKYYPNLLSDMPELLASKIAEQLQYSLNQGELERALHRLHCFFAEIKEPTIDIFKQLTVVKIEVFVALTVIDACKGSPDLQYKETDQPLPKDTVVLSFETLRQMPEIYPIFSGICPEANDFFCRLIKLLSNNKRTADQSSVVGDALMDFGRLQLMLTAATAETECFKQLHLKALTYVPAIFWKLLDLNKEKSLIDCVCIYIKLQTQLFEALKQVPPEKLQGNTSISLFSLTTPATEPFLREFSEDPSKKLALDFTFERLMSTKVSFAPVPAQRNLQGFGYSGSPVQSPTSGHPHTAEQGGRFSPTS